MNDWRNARIEEIEALLVDAPIIDFVDGGVLQDSRQLARDLVAVFEKALGEATVTPTDDEEPSDARGDYRIFDTQGDWYATALTLQEARDCLGSDPGHIKRAIWVPVEDDALEPATLAEIRETYILANTRNWDEFMTGRTRESEAARYGEMFDAALRAAGGVR